MIPSFDFSRCPRIIFGAGRYGELPVLASYLGRTALIVTGAKSLEESGKLDILRKALERQGLRSLHAAVADEPSPRLVDEAVETFRGEGVNVVIAVGGGSVLDAGKAVSAMLPGEGPVIDYLEGVGTGEKHSGRKAPMIAVPTTAGTGSEATKNAVLSRVGPDGFKKSLRHENFVPDVALVDPELSLTCPPAVTAACGMDALTQLLESYVSEGASTLTDALAWSGLERIRDYLIPACSSGAGDVGVRAGMSYAALMSGITLANAGLGVVHGFAAAIGGLFAIPHGVICGTLLGPATRANVAWLARERGPGDEAVRRYGAVGALLAGRQPGDALVDCERLVHTLEGWTDTLEIPRLGAYGVTPSDIDAFVAQTGLKANPAKLDAKGLAEILLSRL